MQLRVTVREVDGGLSEHFDWSAPAEFDAEESRRFRGWQRSLERAGRQIVHIAPATSPRRPELAAL